MASKKSRQSNKILYFGLLAVALLVIGGVAWRMQTNKTDHSTMDMSKSTSSTATNATTTTGKTVEVTMEAGNFYFAPKTISAKKGDTIKITLTGKGMMHDFTLDAFNVQSSTVEPGSTTTVEFVADKTGTFEYYCSIGSHRQRGQAGTLTVE